ncbi:hypothetical protein GpartN1_g663.t1 [Galdieria partita]|uniref:Major facilitator superfamily (MFS) profile domain-containing protein n=1 Tax=Galdieria partita TaxID=83374 RepID=A0A9C7UMR2_9RHOD|nr:hypothetical protein GpartN1_g663.t1 [Galdieria partita]
MSPFLFAQNCWLTYKTKRNCVGSSFKCVVFGERPLDTDLALFTGQVRTQLYRRSLKSRRSRFQEYLCCLYSNAESGSEASRKPNNEKNKRQREIQFSTVYDFKSSPDTTQFTNFAQQKLMSTWRWRVFCGIFISYLSYTICRSTFTFIAPLLLQAKLLQLEHVGLVTSSFPLFYGISKLLGGLVVDNFSPRRILGLGLSLAGLTNVGLGLSDGYRWFAFWWGANGVAQGCGAGACARILTSWFRSSERGFWWALWSCSANVGGVVAPLVSGSLARRTTWRVGMIAPGMLSLIIGVVFSWLIRDTPKEAGLLVEEQSDIDRERKNLAKSEKDLNSSFEYLETFVAGVLKNRTLWLLALSYFFVYFVKSSIRSFFHIYLMQQKGCHATDASYRVSGMDVGGLAGTFISGILSDRLEGHRVPVVISFLMGLVVTLLVAFLMSSTAVNHVWLDFLFVVLFGFFLSGPTCLIGLIGAEQSDRRTVATATGLLGYISYLGAAMAGFPVTLAIRRFGWISYFSTMIFSSFLSVAFLLPLSKSKAKRSEACCRGKQNERSLHEIDGTIS